MSEPRQTLSFLRNLFIERGIHPKSKLGQNFLIDLNLLDLVVRSAEITKDDLVLEVGSGTGGLTTRLCEQARHVLTIEIDPAFFNLTEEVLAGKKNVTLMHADILESKSELNPDVLNALRDLLKGQTSQRLKLVANLPFAIATPLISNLMMLPDLPVERMVVMVQWEIAARFLAVPGVKDYASLAVLVQSLADVELVRKLAPAAFWPRPQVESAIVSIRPNAAKRERVGDVVRFRNFLRDLYVHRRKNLRGALASSPRVKREKADVDQKLADLGIDGTLRAESLDVEQHLRLCAVFGA